MSRANEAPEVGERGPSWVATILVFLLFLALYILTASGHLSTPDEELMFRTTESLATRGSLAIEPLAGFATRRGNDGREYAQYGIGNSVAAIPLYAIGAALTNVLSSESAQQILDFKTTLYLPESTDRGPALLKRFIVSFQGALIAALLVALAWRFAFRMAADTGGRSKAGKAAWLTAIAVGAGTMVWPHSRTFFSEPLATLLILGSFYIAAGSRKGAGFGDAPDGRQGLIAGILFAAALLTRLDSLVMLPGLGLLLLRGSLDRFEKPAQPGSRHSKTIRVCAFAALPVVLAVVLQLTLNRLHFGGWLESGYTDQAEGFHFSTPLLAGLYGFLFSVGKSIILFSPAIVLGLAGWTALGRSNPVLCGGLALAAGLKLVVQSKWQNWSGGWDWGPRHVYFVMAGAALPMAAWIAERGLNRARRILIAVALTLSAAVQMYGTSQHPVDFYMLYYRTPLMRGGSPPVAASMYSPGEVEGRAVAMTEGAGMKLDAARTLYRALSIAPINDSIYVPQNSVWYRYAEMWDLGYRDNLWLRLWRRNEGRERGVE